MSTGGINHIHIHVHSNSPVGESVTGFATGKNGEFCCGNCVHMAGSYCTHPVMISDSKQPKTRAGVVVDHDDCCTFVRRPGD